MGRQALSRSKTSKLLLRSMGFLSVDLTRHK